MNAWWHEAWSTLVAEFAEFAEFADITDASQLTRVAVRLLMAGVLGGILGFEREHKGKAAGMGREATALLSTLLALGVLAIMPVVIGRLGRNGEDER